MNHDGADLLQVATYKRVETVRTFNGGRDAEVKTSLKIKATSGASEFQSWIILGVDSEPGFLM